MNDLYLKLLEVSTKVDIAILSTPTGEGRNAMTEANLYLMEAIDLAKKLLK
jgi:hypothetical protein